MCAAAGLVFITTGATLSHVTVGAVEGAAVLGAATSGAATGKAAIQSQSDSNFTQERGGRRHTQRCNNKHTNKVKYIS